MIEIDEMAEAIEQELDLELREKNLAYFESITDHGDGVW